MPNVSLTGDQSAADTPGGRSGELLAAATESVTAPEMRTSKVVSTRMRILQRMMLAISPVNATGNPISIQWPSA